MITWSDPNQPNELVIERRHYVNHHARYLQLIFQGAHIDQNSLW